MRIFIIFTFIFAGIFSYAGQEVGNGGDVIYCHTSYYEQNTVELLDYYEARVMRGINIDLGAPSMPYLDKVRMAILRLKILSPGRAKSYQQQADTFLSETLFLKKHELVDIPDSANVALPEGCEIKQIVVQKAPQFPEDKRYVINQDLWDLLNEDSKAGLILHELIYREAIELHFHETSISSRYFNSYLAANKFESMTQEKFFRFLSQIKFTTTEVFNCDMRVYVDSSYYDPPGLDKYLKFYSDGSISQGRFSSECTVNTPHVTGIIFPNYEIVSFHKNGYLKLFNLSFGAYHRGNLKTKVANFCDVELYENRSPKIFCISEEAQFPKLGGGSEFVPANSKVELDLEGNLLSVLDK